MSVERNLLFGILAKQLDFIERDQLVAALHSWKRDKQRPLGDLLVEQQMLDPARRELLEALVGAHLQQHGGDARQRLAAVTSMKSVREDLVKLAA